MQGLLAHPEGTLVDRALARLCGGPVPSSVVTEEIMGIPRAPVAVADRLAAALLGADPRVHRRWDGLWQLAALGSATHRLADCTFAVVDVETTGSRAGMGDRITEIAVVLVGPDGVETVCEHLVNPERPIPRAVTAVTRITNEMVRHQPVFAEIADEVLAALSGRIFVAHNVKFDWRFVSAELKRARGVRLDGPRLCTVHLARRLVMGLASRGLDSLTRYFGIEIDGRHRAGGDARATAQVLTRLIDLAREEGATTFEDLGRVDRRRKKKRTRRPDASPGWMDGI